MQWFDVWQQEDSENIVPVEIDVKAETPEQACEIIAQERHIDVSNLQAFEASNPGYREI